MPAKSMPTRPGSFILRKMASAKRPASTIRAILVAMGGIPFLNHGPLIRMPLRVAWLVVLVKAEPHGRTSRGLDRSRIAMP